MADSYTVTRQEQVTDATDVTNPVAAMLIAFRSNATGVTGSVTVPLTDYTPQEVNRRISERVALIDAVHEL